MASSSSVHLDATATRSGPPRRWWLPSGCRFPANRVEMTTPPAAARRKITVPAITAMKGTGDKIAMITAYDATFATIVDAAGVDIILVGDSVATVIQGEHTTIPVSLDEMAYHVRMVTRARTAALVV